jgi:MYXO-CTERM domain-containing protein
MFAARSPAPNTGGKLRPHRPHGSRHWYARGFRGRSIRRGACRTVRVNGNRPHISVAHAQAGAGCLEAAEKKRGHGSPDNFAAVTAAALTAAAVIRRRREAIGIA